MPVHSSVCIFNYCLPHTVCPTDSGPSAQDFPERCSQTCQQMESIPLYFLSPDSQDVWHSLYQT